LLEWEAFAATFLPTVQIPPTASLVCVVGLPL
jgi:hypothetical protein